MALNHPNEPWWVSGKGLVAGSRGERGREKRQVTNGREAVHNSFSIQPNVSRRCQLILFLTNSFCNGNYFCSRIQGKGGRKQQDSGRILWLIMCQSKSCTLKERKIPLPFSFINGCAWLSKSWYCELTDLFLQQPDTPPARPPTWSLSTVSSRKTTLASEEFFPHNSGSTFRGPVSQTDDGNAFGKKERES